ncbi:hypothetical protein JXR93_12390 [bacterium]|nr:hypothetical protein [bacterium]
MIKKIFYIIILISLIQNPLFGEWKTIESKNFKLSYESDFELMAQKAIEDLEAAHKLLIKYLKNTPPKTRVVISDTVDDSNGFARLLPFPLIHLYPYPPETDSELGYYSDWLFSLLVHEYTHTVHLTSMGAIHKFINSILGPTVTPSQLLPKWIIEGIAVYFESQLTGRGRVNSPYYQMMFRTSILHHNFSLAEISNITTIYPYGGLYYLYGAFFIYYLFQNDYNKSELASFIKNYGEQLIPYGINGAYKKGSNKTFENCYDDFIKEKKQEAKNLLAKLELQKLTKYKEILKERVKSISIFNDKLLIYSGGAEDLSKKSIYDGEKIVDSIPFKRAVSNIIQIDNTLFYSSFERVKNSYFRLLKRYNLDNLEESTELEKLRVVSFTKDENSYNFALVVNELGKHNIYIYNILTKKISKITEFTSLTTLDSPIFKNSDKIIVTINNNDNFWDIIEIDIATKKITYLTKDNFYNISPTYDSENKKLYYISNREDNILNLYEYKNSLNIIKQTNFFSGIVKVLYHPTLKKFYASLYRAENGFGLIEIEPENLINNSIEFKNNNLLTDKNSINLENSNISIDKNSIEYFNNINKIDSNDINQIILSKDRVDYKKYDFSIFPEILPKSFSPNIESSNFKNQISIDLSNSDVRDLIYYQSILGYDFDIDDIFFTFYIGDNSHSIRYSLGYGFTPLIMNNFYVNGVQKEYLAQYHSFSGSISFPFSDINGSNFLYISSAYRWFTFSKLEYEYSPWDIPPKLPEQFERFFLSFGYYYGDLDYLIKTPGVSNGNSLNIQFSLRDKDIMSLENYISFALQYKFYKPIPIFYSSIAARYTYSLSYSENGLYSNFIGGYPPATSFIDSLIDRTAISGIFLRGYPMQYFKSIALNILNLEYRVHIWESNIGYATIPVYIHEFYFKVFYDVASISKKLFDFEPKHGVGAELTMLFYLGYVEGYNFSLGYSYGLNTGGEHQYYFNFTSLF